MSEIKSTMDLIMERTQGLRLSDTEKTKLRTEELEKKARGLRLRIMENPVRLDEILEQFTPETSGDRDVVMATLWRLMIDAIPTDETVFKYLTLLRKFPEGRKRVKTLALMRDALQVSTKRFAAEKKKVLTRERKKLANLGISGDAVVPKLPENVKASRLLQDTITAHRPQLLA